MPANEIRKGFLKGFKVTTPFQLPIQRNKWVGEIKKRFASHMAGELDQLRELDGVYGIIFVGSSPVGLSTDKNTDIDTAIILDPQKFDSLAKEIERITGARPIGKRDDGIPYVLHKDYPDLDILLVPMFNDIKHPFDMIFRRAKNRISLQEALKMSPVSRTVLHRFYFEKLPPDIRKKLLDIKSQWKRLGLWRDGISTLQLALLLDEAKRRDKDVKEFIISEDFDNWIKTYRSPFDKNRYPWASLLEKPWLIRLLKIWAQHPNVKSREELYSLIGPYSQIFIPIRLQKDERSKAVNMALKLKRHISQYNYNMDIVDVYANDTGVKVYYILRPEKKRVNIEAISNNAPQVLERYISEGRLVDENDIPYTESNMLPETAYLLPKYTKDEIAAEINNFAHQLA